MEHYLNSQPILESERLVLKEIDEDYYHQLFSYRNNLELCELSGMSRDLSIVDTIRFMNNVNRNIYFHRFYYWGIFLNDTLIGVISYSGIDKYKRSGEFGYFIGFKYQRQGYMFEALTTVLEYLFLECDTTEVNAYIRTDNKPSQELATKIGFQQFEKTEEEDMGGNVMDMYRFNLKREWFNV